MALSVSRNPYTGLPDLIGTGGGAGGGAAISAGAASQSTGTVIFSNSNGISFGLNAGTLTASYTVPTQTQFVLSNSNGLTFGTNGSTVTGSYSVPSVAGLISAINASAGTTSNNLTAFVMSNSNGLAFGLSGSTITGSYTVPTVIAPVTLSYYPYPQGPFSASGFIGLGQSSIHVFPVVLNNYVSAGYLRLSANHNIALLNSTIATSANVSLTFRQTDTYWAHFMTQQTGASSQSIASLTSASATAVWQVRGEVGAASNNQTIYYDVTYNAAGTTSSFSTTYNVNSASIVFASSNIPTLSGSKFYDLPFSASLSPGNYWIALARSSATATTGGTLANFSFRVSHIGIAQDNGVYRPIGVSTGGYMQVGLGYWTTNTNGTTTSQMAFSQLSSTASNPVIAMQLIKDG